MKIHSFSGILLEDMLQVGALRSVQLRRKWVDLAVDLHCFEDHCNTYSAFGRRTHVCHNPCLGFARATTCSRQASLASIVAGSRSLISVV